jgi:hypothetical protein
MGAPFIDRVAQYSGGSPGDGRSDPLFLAPEKSAIQQADLTAVRYIVSLVLFGALAGGNADYALGQEKVLRLSDGPIRALAFSKDGERLAVGSFDRTLDERKIIV